ncbi:hypothetical protein BU14_0294s0005 [Porphyra umbilicalis]|uniref:Uncharacterized protein n=1 Tax=Porphyra umbilicalis TaxID=2786 RepID=A0A1X6P0C5_PORUM|nr:hypothetical protein BU14_0294s0005 [Porphyra umbilicalis]|eukprot:OSX74314.1 hypothetical protein BU14_0294s0005 [Porphyra umbilicalis]
MAAAAAATAEAWCVSRRCRLRTRARASATLLPRPLPWRVGPFPPLVCLCLCGVVGRLDGGCGSGVGSCTTGTCIRLQVLRRSAACPRLQNTSGMGVVSRSVPEL